MKGTNKLYIILFALLLLSGTALVAYPAVSNAVNEANGSYAIAQLARDMESGEESRLEKEKALALEYNAGLIDGQSPEASVLYEDILCFAGGIMAYIDIPRLGLCLPIYHGVDDSALAKGVGHMPDSAFPVGGVGSHSVLVGHTGLHSAKLFTGLDELEEGDIFYINILNETLTYKVDKISVVLPHETEELLPRPGHDYCTLLTCTPYGINSHRLLVRGERSYTEEAANIAREPDSQPGRITLPAVAGLALAAGIAAIFIIRFSRKNSV